ncbi:multidrug transporter AcrB [Amylibacter marinus]|uniref:Multidrug transporter AcrB n=1 Tax=Amylibacter marinus TaxID=1475483 RepID=A0ABQ5VX78_9RHOB|nr:efflux RND transporter permease subunit [Amylibacter marinus]GLQ35904.1 multidrug transporter AcrB [Amylibacter marinus]
MRSLSGGISGILSYFTRHKTAANLLLVIMLVTGVVATGKIRSQFFPDVVIEGISVNVAWSGAGPEDVDAGIVSLLEPALLSVEGVKATSSSAQEGRAYISLEFEANWDMARAAEDVKTVVDAVDDLPEAAEEPVVRRAAFRDRVTDVIISGPVSVDQLGRFADEFAARLFRAGITRTTTRGISAPEIQVLAPEAKLIEHDVTLSEIASIIAAESEAAPAGDVANGAARVRTGITKQSASEIGAFVVRSSTEGGVLRIQDVAQINVLGVDASRSYYVGQHPAVSLRVDRVDQGDAIKMQALVQEIAGEMQATLPEGVTIELIRTRAQAIQDRLGLLLQNGLMGLTLVVGLLFLFLSARTAFWVAAGIPVAMFAAVGLMYAFGLTLNMVSLFGLIITLGIVVDDAIVVAEHADFRARRLGEDPITASEHAAMRMAPPVFSATITTVIAFWGLTLIGGRFGTLIADIPFTVIVVLLASLVECFIILPNHMSHSLSYHAGLKWYDVPSHYFNRGFSAMRERFFKPLMRWILILRYPLLGAAVLLLSLNLALFVGGEVKFRFFSPPERASVSGNIAMYDGASRADTKVMVEELQRAVTQVGADFEKEHGVNPVTFAMVEVGGNTGRGLAGVANKDADLKGSIAVELIDADARPYSANTFIAALQDEVRSHPLMETLSFRGFRFGPGGDSLDVQFIGIDSQTLKAASEEFKAQVSAQFPEVTSLEDDLPYDKEELVLELTPQGQALGFTTDAIGRELRNRLSGISAASFPTGARTTEVTVGLPSEEITADFLDRTRLRAPSGTYVPLVDIVTIERSLGFSTVLRENGLRLMSVTGEIPEDDPARASEIVEKISGEILPQIAKDFGIEYRLSGLAEQEREFLNDALIGFMLCLLGIYLALCWIFASWTRPLVVMSVIPFGAIGMIYGHWVMEVPLSMFSIVGMIGMSGIIINDSIVLVTTIEEYSEKRALMPAIVSACADRLRPVLLTTLTTVLGLTPLMFEQSVQAQFLKPTIITLVFGLGFGMFLVLLVVPAMVVMQRDFGRLLISTRRMILRPAVDRASVIMRMALGAIIALFAATMGVLVITLEAAGFVRALTSDQMPALAASLAVFIIGASLIVLLAAAGFYLRLGLPKTAKNSR